MKGEIMLRSIIRQDAVESMREWRERTSPIVQVRVEGLSGVEQVIGNRPLASKLAYALSEAAKMRVRGTPAYVSVR